MQFDFKFLKYSFFAILFLLKNIFAQANQFVAASLIIDSYNSNSDKVKIGLLVKLQPDWHIYWKNPGDTGMATTFELSVPQGFRFSEINFPVPKTFEFEGLVSYGYDNEVLFTSEIYPQTKKEYGVQTFSVRLKSLICKDVCIPFDTTINFTINFDEEYIAPKETTELFFKTSLQLPIYNPSINLRAELNSELLYIRLRGLPFKKDKINSVYFLPYENGYFFNSIHQKINWYENYIELIVEPDPFRTEIPNQILGVVIFEGDIDKIAYEIKIPISKNTNN